MTPEKGTWAWACEQAVKGKIVKRAVPNGFVYMKFNEDEMMVWSCEIAIRLRSWDEMYTTIDDVLATDWEVVE